MNIYYHTLGRGLRYEPDPIDRALCEVCGTCLATEEETDAGVWRHLRRHTPLRTDRSRLCFRCRRQSGSLRARRTKGRRRFRFPA